LISSHTFSFLSPSSEDKSNPKQNIITISEEDEKKHFIQYIEYKKSFNGIMLRYAKMKVDRSYYLEIANVNLDNRNRKRHIFSVLGKRRFGANTKRIDYYLFTKTLDLFDLDNHYKNFNESVEFKASHTQKTDYSTNEYRIHSIDIDTTTLYFLDQKNSSQRKKLHKTFGVELTKEEIKTFKSMINEKQKVEYLFNKIGKIYFKSLEKNFYKLTDEFATPKSLALSKLLTSSLQMETKSNTNNSLVFHKLKKKSSVEGRVDLSFYNSYLALVHNPYNEEAIDTFYAITDVYLHCVEEIHELKDIKQHFINLKSLVQAGTIPYLLTKNDNDLKDIFLYMLESFNVWTSYIHHDAEDLKAFNLATVDFEDSLRHLVDICYKFKHEYKCNEVEFQETCPILTTDTAYNSELIITSAQTYFNEVDLEPEVLDELLELENDIAFLDYTHTWTPKLQTTLSKFFDGYTSALNPLFEFKDLSYSLMLLSQKLQEYKEDESVSILITLLRSFINDLLTWKKTVLLERTAENIHYMDKSFYSNIAQIEMSMGQRDSNNEEDEIEFF